MENYIGFNIFCSVFCAIHLFSSLKADQVYFLCNLNTFLDRAAHSESLLGSLKLANSVCLQVCTRRPGWYLEGDKMLGAPICVSDEIFGRCWKWGWAGRICSAWEKISQSQRLNSFCSLLCTLLLIISMLAP